VNSLSQLVDSLLHNTVALSLPAFRTELAICATIVLMLLLRVFRGLERIDAFYIALAGSLVGLWLALPWTQPESLLAADGHVVRHELFTGMLTYDSFTLFFRGLLMFFAVVFVTLTRLSGIPDREDAPDFYSLVLGATLGMCIMASANHVVTIFLGVEMASVPSYALAGMLKGRRKSSEAALKYSIYGAGAAGIMLYGLSLLAGVLGSCHLPTMTNQLAEFIQAGTIGDRTMVLVLGGLMVMVGLAFKLSAVPFHFWCPDVFEGASAEVNAFLSVASKAAALALLIRVTVGFGFVEPSAKPAVPVTALVTALKPVTNSMTGRLATANPVAYATGSNSDAGSPSFADVRAGGRKAPEGAANRTTDPRIAALNPVRSYMAVLVGFIAAITCTFGNLAAYGQTNIKRLLAYSTIAHAGYMMMPVAAGLVLAGKNPAAAEAAFAAVPLYAGVYLFMNLGAFAIVAFLRNTLRSEEIADYAGLIRTSPGLVICFGTILFSLVGMPPLAGFSGKFVIFSTLVDGIQNDAARGMMITLLVVGGLNTAVSLFYYLRVVKVMAFEPEPKDRPPFTFPLVSFPGAYVVAITLPVLLLGLWWNDLYEWAHRAASQLLW
jgi:NADH-quinone oxidoreductase subunit N